MSRKRLIDPELFYKSEIISALKARGTLQYIQLWCLAEDWGGYVPDYPSIALKMGALRFSAKEIEKNCNILIEKKKVIPYITKDGRKIHWIKNFLEHQSLKNPSPPKNPLPDWIACKIKRFPSGKKYAIYSVVYKRLPVDYQYTTGSLQEATSRLPVGAKQKQKQKPYLKEAKEESMRETKKVNTPLLEGGKDEDKKEKEIFLLHKNHLQNQCEVLINTFKNKENGKDFDPLKFIMASIKSKIPVEVYKKVLDSMVKQKDRIQNPMAWIIAVLKKEEQGYRYTEELKKHYIIKSQQLW